MADYVLCGCERNQFNADQYTSCYECYLERAEGMASCVFCGRWHSYDYATCYRCRTQYNRDEAGAAIRTYIEWRDEYRCRNCSANGVINIDHIRPCRHGGGAALWNLQVLCADCNRVKASGWIPGGQWSHIRRGLFAYYYTRGKDWLHDEQRQDAHQDTDARQPLSDLELWERWLAHGAAIVAPCALDERVESFHCPQCFEPSPTLYGLDKPTCKTCWTANRPTPKGSH